MKVGDIVRTPVGGLYGNKPAIVAEVRSTSIRVLTATAELLYEPAQLTPLATIEIGKRTYATPGANRFRVCFIHYAGATQAQERHVLVGTKGEAAETRAFEVRKLLFKGLLEDKVWE